MNDIEGSGRNSSPDGLDQIREPASNQTNAARRRAFGRGLVVAAVLTPAGCLAIDALPSSRPVVEAPLSDLDQEKQSQINARRADVKRLAVVEERAKFNALRQDITENTRGMAFGLIGGLDGDNTLSFDRGMATNYDGNPTTPDITLHVDTSGRWSLRAVGPPRDYTTGQPYREGKHDPNNMVHSWVAFQFSGLSRAVAHQDQLAVNDIKQFVKSSQALQLEGIKGELAGREGGLRAFGLFADTKAAHTVWSGTRSNTVALQGVLPESGLKSNDLASIDVVLKSASKVIKGMDIAS